MLEQAAASTQGEVNAAVWKAYQQIFSLESEPASRGATERAARGDGGIVTDSGEMGDLVQPVVGETGNCQRLEQSNLWGEQSQEDQDGGASFGQGS